MQHQNVEEAQEPPSHPALQQKQQRDRQESALSSFQASSKRSLLASMRRREGEEEKSRNSAAKLSILVPQNLSFNSLAASGTLQWKHILFSPLKSFYDIKEARELTSLQTPSSDSSRHSSFRDGVSLPLVGELRWEDLSKSVKVWLRNPKNLALLLWGIAVGASGAMLFLIMVGFLDHAISNKSKRDAWFEANNQILNALFTLMCLYMHPQRLLHLFLLYRWQPSDIKKLRDAYCKDGEYKPHEWSSMLIVVLLLNLNCFAQYALCGLNWGYRRADRPALGVGLCLAVAIGAPAVAGIYTILSPLGKDYEEDAGHLAEREEIEKKHEKSLDNKPSIKIGKGWKNASKFSFVTRDGSVVKQPQWKGGLFDIRSDPQISWFTLFCGFCVFGWNMERLGFGNRFVHIVTFILLCTAPYWIFFLAATNIDNSYVRHGLSYGGILLCVFGLLYGGFWRIQMRRTYGLPAQTWCCGRAGLTDCFQWLFCSLCSLCQEVRTSEAYKIHNSKFYDRHKSVGPSSNSTPHRPLPSGEDFAVTALNAPPVTVFVDRDSQLSTEISTIHLENWEPPPPTAFKMPAENGKSPSPPLSKTAMVNGDSPSPPLPKKPMENGALLSSLPVETKVIVVDDQ